MAGFIKALTMGAMGPPGSIRSLNVSLAIPLPGPAPDEEPQKKTQDGLDRAREDVLLLRSRAARRLLLVGLHDEDALALQELVHALEIEAVAFGAVPLGDMNLELDKTSQHAHVALQGP
jgi:hypothetical protein